ncbi:hypothetical protein MKW98_014340 [Papaver atlanticum]|uniref:Uncharacterized protein n=1 Tax=Papaver atlanticum TaxID=357466 RepID=A0AAD4SP77_9MAGN|nr:hypothetical protein MKW98_014340 [Papaver atlanticum]
MSNRHKYLSSSKSKSLLRGSKGVNRRRNPWTKHITISEKAFKEQSICLVLSASVTRDVQRVVFRKLWTKWIVTQILCSVLIGTRNLSKLQKVWQGGEAINCT